jgi:hypothetical protein
MKEIKGKTSKRLKKEQLTEFFGFQMQHFEEKGLHFVSKFQFLATY